MIRRLFQKNISFLFFCTVPFFLIAEKPLLLGIAGGSGSGKTFLSNEIQDILQEKVLVLGQDSYYKDLSNTEDAKRASINFDHPDAIDFALMKSHIEQLLERKSIDKPIYDFASHKRSGSERVDARSIIIIEGILILAVQEIRDLLDIKVFVDVDDDIRLLRRIKRDVQERGRSIEGIEQQYLYTVRPMYKKFVDSSKSHADFLLSSNVSHNVFLDILISYMRKARI